MNVRIGKVINSNLEAIKSNTHNIFIGISLGNKYFTKENIKEYVVWALKNTKERVAILIVDEIHSVNYEVRSSHYSRERAMSAALRIGQEKLSMIKKIINSLSQDQKEKVDVLLWKNIEKEPGYKKSIQVIESAFENNTDFHDEVLNVVKANIDPNTISLDEKDYEKLATYPLKELPVLISGFHFSETFFNLVPYPGIGAIDNLVVEIQNDIKFPEITKALNIQEKCVIVEAYVK